MCSNHTNHTSYNHHHSRANSRSRFELYNFNTNEDQALINKKLPKELILRIFSFLDVVTLCRCAQVSKVTIPPCLMFFFEIVVLNLSRRCVGFLKSLSLKGCKSVGDSALRIFAQQCKNIEELCLEGCKRISDRYVFMGINALRSTCPFKDKLFGCHFLSRSAVLERQVVILTICKLRILNFIKPFFYHRTLEAAQCSQFTDAGFQALCRGCNQLQRLDLEECVQITDSTLNHLSLWCSGLQKLSLSHCELITDEGIRHFCGSPCAIDHIEELELDNCPLITDNALDYLINCHQLKRVELFDCQLITKAGTRRLRAHLPDLRVHEYFAPVTPPPSVGGGRQRMCRCCVML
ncbi:PREDICTED: F-box/LRR-repeat protein 20-like [Acropora digitifera]|uniref:F-box/LRR-repeat protein 20-like n=1 Tax=Acropora digitifera TaxID=70779 RepID=UPI00077A249C|nr:PREDICTED: F-box/LRR-repeat protein 20-like [Acropora digitifera]